MIDVKTDVTEDQGQIFLLRAREKEEKKRDKSSPRQEKKTKKKKDTVSHGLVFLKHPCGLTIDKSV